MECQSMTMVGDAYLQELNTCRTWENFLILEKKFSEFLLTLNAKNEIKSLFDTHGITGHIPVSIKTFLGEIFDAHVPGLDCIQKAACINCSAKPKNVRIIPTTCPIEQSCLCSKQLYQICNTCINEQLGDEVTCQIPCKTCKGSFCLFGVTPAPSEYHHAFLPNFDNDPMIDDQLLFQEVNKLTPNPPQILDQVIPGSFQMVNELMTEREQGAHEIIQPDLLIPQFHQQPESLNTNYEYEVLDSGTAPECFYPELLEGLIDPTATPIEKIEIRLKDMYQILVALGQRIDHGPANERLLLRASGLIIDTFKDLNDLSVPEPRVIIEPIKFPPKRLESDITKGKRKRNYKCKLCGLINPGHYEKKCPGPTLSALAELASQKKKLNPHYLYDDGED